MKRALENRIALITGGGRGIGAATARLFAREGARVCVVSRTPAQIDSIVSAISAESGKDRAIGRACDISSPEQVEALFAWIHETWGGGVDLLVNNAAVVGKGAIEDLTVEAWDQVMAVNLRGPFLCSRALFADAKRTGQGGAIVNMSSLGGIRSTEKFKGLAAYVVSKSGIVGLTEAFAVEGREIGVRVNCVAPGAVDTEMLRQAAPHLKTNTQPEQVADIIAYLCDDARSGALSGSTLEVHSNL